MGEFVTQLPKNIIPLALQVAAQQREYIELRQQAQTADRTVERSFLHVLDSCEAMMATLQWLNTQQYTCQAFNIAGPSISIRALLTQISTVTQTEIKTIEAPFYAYPELDQLGAITDKAQQLLKWQASRDLNKIIEDAWRFYQNTLQRH